MLRSAKCISPAQTSIQISRLVYPTCIFTWMTSEHLKHKTEIVIISSKTCYSNSLPISDIDNSLPQALKLKNGKQNFHISFPSTPPVHWKLLSTLYSEYIQLKPFSFSPPPLWSKSTSCCAPIIIISYLVTLLPPLPCIICFPQSSQRDLIKKLGQIIIVFHSKTSKVHT